MVQVRARVLEIEFFTPQIEFIVAEKKNFNL